MSNQQKKNTFYGAAAILTVSTILVKIIGAIFKIPLIAILPEEAYGDFNGAYNIYSFFLTISTAGLPVALSKTVSECHTLGRENQKHRVFRVAFCAFLFMGLFSFLCMSVFGQLVATYIIGNEKAVFCVWALAPAVLCTCCCSAFRGYAQGHMNMMPTAISQIIEALCKLFLGLGLAMVIMSLTLWPEDIRNRLAASGALIGVSFGSVLSVIYLAFNHFRTRRGSAARAADQPDRSRVVLARLLKLAIPITLSSCSMSLVTIIDTNLVNNQLQNVFTAIQGGMTGISNSFLDIFPKAVEIFQNNTDAWQQALLTDPATKLDPILDSARSLYGTYSKTMSVYNLPFNLMIPLSGQGGHRHRQRGHRPDSHRRLFRRSADLGRIQRRSAGSGRPHYGTHRPGQCGYGHRRSHPVHPGDCLHFCLLPVGGHRDPPGQRHSESAHHYGYYRRRH